MKIQYIGRKLEKADTVAGTGLIWGPLQVHDVADAPAGLLLRHPDIWALADAWEPVSFLPSSIALAAAVVGGIGPVAVPAGYYLTADNQLVDQDGKPVVFAHLATETVTYTDGTTATGIAPLPLQSPAQQDAAAGAKAAGDSYQAVLERVLLETAGPAPEAAPAAAPAPAPAPVPDAAATPVERLRAMGIDQAELVLGDMTDEDVREIGNGAGLELDARNKGQAMRVKVLDALFPKE